MKRFPRLFAGVLILCMLLCLFPTALAHEETSPDDVFAAINTAIDALQTQKSKPTDAQKTAVAKSAVQGLGYAVDDNGSEQFTWYVGSTACVYSTRLRELAAQGKPTDGDIGNGESVTVNYGKREFAPGAVDVALIAPYYGLDDNFTDTYRRQCEHIAATTGGAYTLYETTAATVDSIAAALQTSAVVLFDSHGITDYENGDDNTSRANTSYLCLQSGEGLTSADQASVAGEFGTYQHAMYGGYSGDGDDKMHFYCVDGTALTNHMSADAPNSLVWNAICLGMATDGICAPLREKGVGVVYGYSQSVYFSGDYAYQDIFWDEMTAGTTVSDAISYMKDMKGAWDTCDGNYHWSTVEEARSNYAAFPIIVSDEDPYPGQGNVDDLQTVVSTWRLLTPYLVTACSSDDAKGTVTLTGGVITAQSASGYYAADCSVEPVGAATVTQNGNRFTLTGITQNCTVTVLFAPKTPASVYFAVPDGVIQAPLDVRTGDLVTLPTPQGKPDGDKIYTFLGWMEEPVPGTEVLPDYLSAGSSHWVSGDTTLYALYEYLDDSAGSTTDFVRKDISLIEPTDPVVITMRYQTTVYALHGGNGAKAAPSAMIVGVANNTIRNPVQAIRWNIENKNGSLHFYPAGKTDSWLYCSGNDNGVRVGTSAGNTFTVSGNYLKNTETGRYLGVYRSNPDWRCYTGTAGALADQTLCFYAAKAGTVRYSTLVAHVWDRGTVTAPPTCTQEGVRTYTCTLCGETRTEAIAATGHHDNDGDGLCDDCPYLKLSAENGVPGGTLTVNLYLRNNPGICTAMLDITYDTQKLQLLSVTDANLLQGGVFSGTLSELPYRLYWDQSADSDCPQNGLLAQLHFAVLETATAGETQIGLSYDSDNIYNMQQQSVSFGVAAGIITLRDYLPGDADEDGTLGAKDVTLLRRYLAGGWDVTVNETVCDVNGDGAVNAKDVTLLRRYLAGGWDVVLR